MVEPFDIKDPNKLLFPKSISLTPVSAPKRTVVQPSLSMIFKDATSSLFENMAGQKPPQGVSFTPKRDVIPMSISDHAGKPEPPGAPDRLEIPLPSAHVVCGMYLVYSVVLSLGCLLLPAYEGMVALAMAPLFMSAVAFDACPDAPHTRFWIALVLVVTYPAMAIMQSKGIQVLAGYLLFYLAFVLSDLSKNKSLPYRISIGVLTLACIIGLVVYVVYPRSVHGVQATFLAVTVLTCTNLVWTSKPRAVLVVKS